MPELADGLIVENKRTKAKTLDLANCGLSAIPAEVGELLWLQTLHFLPERFDHDSGELVKTPNQGPSNAPLTGLRTLRRLTALRTLSLTANKAISSIKQLSALQSLDLSSTQVSDVTPLASLSTLQSTSARLAAKT